MMKQNERAKKDFIQLLIHYRYELLAIFIPGFILGLAYASVGIYPVGNKNLLIIDMYHQYAPFLSELQTKLQSLTSLFYTWNAGLGVNFWSTISYYLASPLNIILVLFSKNGLVDAILCLTILKAALSGLFAFKMIEHICETKTFLAVTFSSFYALSGFVLGYSWNIMWMDTLMLLPLVILGMVQVIQKKSGVLFVISLSIVLISNFYTAFFLCVFVLLYFPLAFIDEQHHAHFGNFLSTTFRLGSMAVLSAGISAFMVYPTIIAMGNTSAIDDTPPKAMAQFYDLFDFFARFFAYAKPTVRDGMPNIYIGSFALLLIPLFFLSKTVSRKTKIAYFGLFLLMIFSMNLNWPNFLWHGMHYPNQLPNRFAFTFTLFVMMISYQGILRLKEFSSTDIMSISGVLLIVMLLQHKINDQNADYPSLYLNILLLAGYTIALTSGKRFGKKPNTAYIAFAIVAIVELSSNTIIVENYVNQEESYAGRADYMNGKEVDNLRDALASLKDSDSNFYRVSVYPSKTVNDPSLYGYPGLDIFSSMQNEKVTRVIEDFGYHSNSINSFKGEGSTQIMDSLLGIKYTIRRNLGVEEFTNEKIWSKEGISIYQNAYPLSIGFEAPENISSWSSDQKDPFAVQNELMGLLTGKEKLLQPAALVLNEVQFVELTPGEEGRFSLKRTTQDKEVRFFYQVTNLTDGYKYLYWETNPAMINSCYIRVNDVVYTFSPQRSTIANLGFCKSSDTITLEFVASAKAAVDGSYRLLSATMDKSAFEEAYHFIKDREFIVDKKTDDRILGHINMKENGILMTSIPYDAGWSISDSNGRKLKTIAISDGLLGVSLEKGVHTLKFKFIPTGFFEGFVITIGSLIFLLLATLFKWRIVVGKKNRVYQNKTEVSQVELQPSEFD